MNVDKIIDIEFKENYVELKVLIKQWNTENEEWNDLDL